ncbi:ATP-binding protein [Streptomyces sp. ML-6]|uniref:ATP-binding protein n=1 Tax=Streptomyces sp. ML-6 TaxID=2982693 RepID=UPI0024C08677|nr:ATP-binding protein [Streptomyces sp. ML-6]MDK0520875.1 ATP-binding protein [Streptomyces sp. ML-6]
MSIWWSLHLRREAASVPLARRFLLGTMETAGVDPDISFDLSLALSEACANAVEHGGDHRDAEDREIREGRSVALDPWDVWDELPGSASGQYRVTAYLDGEKCRIEVADSGPGFPARQPSGTSAERHGPQPCEAQPYESYEAQPYESYEAQPCEFSPQYPSLSAEDGRGLCLIEQLADHVHFGNRPGRGAVVSFDKVLKWRKDALLMVS